MISNNINNDPNVNDIKETSEKIMSSGSHTSPLHGPVQVTLTLDESGERKSTFQFSVHKAPTKHFKKQIGRIFTQVPEHQVEHMLIIPTFQKSQNDLVCSNPIVNKERDDLLDNVSSPMLLRVNIITCFL